MTIPKRKGLRNSQADIKIEDPSVYTPDPALESHWQDLEFISNLPVIKARIGVQSEQHDVQCMIDSGKSHCCAILKLKDKMCNPL